MSNIVKNFVALLLSLTMICPASAAQQQGAPPPQKTQSAFGEDIRLTYVLSANDQIMIRVPGAEDITEKTFQLDSEGMLALPLVGSLKAAGLTIRQLEEELAKKLSAYLRSPQVTITALQYRSDLVYFVGTFQKPGIYPLQGQHKVTEMLAVVGGLLANAGLQVTVTRRLDQGRIPLPSAVDDKDRGTSVAEIKLTRSMATVYPEDDIILKPNDMIRAVQSQEEMIYIQGAKTGSVPLGEKTSLSVLQVISMAGGLPPEAKLQKAVVLRPVMDSARRAELPLNLKAIMAGKANDFPLLPNDVLVVPQSSSSGKMLLYLVPTLIGAALTGVIYAVTQ